METVLVTALVGLIAFLAGQFLLKWVIEPVQELRKTIGAISHTLIERANVIQNPGVPTMEVMHETSEELRKLSSKLQSHLYLIPRYSSTARVFRLPSHAKIEAATSALIGLSNSVYEARPDVYKINAKRVETICDSLGIYLSADKRWPKDLK